MNAKKVAMLSSVGVASIVGLSTILGTVYTIDEGNVGVISRGGRAVLQVGPGFHTKTPFIESLDEFEVREKIMPLTLIGLTADGLPTTVEFSINWTLNSSEALNVFRKYGGMEQFESRVLMPIITQYAKAGINQSTSDDLRERVVVVNRIMGLLDDQLEDLPVSISVPNIGDFSLPDQFLQGLQDREQARLAKERATQELERQNIEAQQQVQLASAAADALRIEADAQAYKTKTQAEATAEANLKIATARAEGLKLEGEALKNSPETVALKWAENWEGGVPKVVMQSTQPWLMGAKEVFE